MSGLSSSTETATPAAIYHPHPGVAFYVIIVSAIALFSAEIWITALGTLWALNGLLSLGGVGTAIVAAVLLPFASFATWKLAVMTFESERDLLNGPPTHI